MLLSFAFAYGLIALGIWPWAAFLIVAGAYVLLAALAVLIGVLKVTQLERRCARPGGPFTMTFACCAAVTAPLPRPRLGRSGVIHDPRDGDASIYIDGPWSHRSVSANGTRFHVAESGDGPLVLLLHGFPEFWWTWRGQLTSLSQAGYRAAAVDLRGYGGSDKPPRGYDLVTAASDAAGLVRSLGEANAVVVGHDWGGLVAWTMAAYFPKVVRRLAVVSVPHPLRLRAAVLSDPLGPGPAAAATPSASSCRCCPSASCCGDGARAGRPDAARPGPVPAGRTPRHGAAVPRRDVHAVRGPLRAGVSPLVPAVPAPAGRPAVRAAHAARRSRPRRCTCTARWTAACCPARPAARAGTSTAPVPVAAAGRRRAISRTRRLPGPVRHASCCPGWPTPNQNDDVACRHGAAAGRTRPGPGQRPGQRRRGRNAAGTGTRRAAAQRAAAGRAGPAAAARRGRRGAGAGRAWRCRRPRAGRRAAAARRLAGRSTRTRCWRRRGRRRRPPSATCGRAWPRSRWA